jgi:hypothetical protein
MSDEYYYREGEIWVTNIGAIDKPGTRAQINVAGFPDGQPKNSLSSDELREVASMLKDAADELEVINE